VITVRKEVRDGGEMYEDNPGGDRQGAGDGEWRVKMMRGRRARDRSGGESERKGDGRNEGDKVH